MQFLLLMVGAIVFSTTPLFAMNNDNEDDNSSFLLFQFSDDFSEKESQKPFPVQRQNIVWPILSKQPPDQPQDSQLRNFARSAPVDFSPEQLRQRKEAKYVWDD